MTGHSRSTADGNAVKFDAVMHAELDEISTRREVAGLPSVAERKDGSALERAAQSELVGLALSGGGVRSAAFSLGVLQGLQKNGALQRVDYLSTVSGGGYAGAYLSSSALSTGASETHEQTVTAAPNGGSHANPPRPGGTANPAGHQRRNREERHLEKALGNSSVQLPRIRQLLGSGGFLWDKLHWMNRQLVGMLLIWSVVLSGLVAVSSLTAYLFRMLDYLTVREVLNGIGVRDDLTLALFPPMVLLALYFVCWTISYWRSPRLAKGNTARKLLMLFVTISVVAVTAMMGNGDLSMDEVSRLVTGEPLSPEWQIRVEQWLPTAVYSFLAASLIPYLNPRRLFRSGEEGSSSLEQLTFNLTSAALVYGVPFLLVAYFAHENISLYAQRRIPFLVPGDIQKSEGTPAPIFRAMLAEEVLEKQSSKVGVASERPPAQTIVEEFRQLVKSGVASEDPPQKYAGKLLLAKLKDRWLDAQLSFPPDLEQLKHESARMSLRMEPSGTANEVAEQAGFENPHSEIGWLRRARHLAVLLTSLPQTDSQTDYEYLKVMRYRRQERAAGERQAHLMNHLLMDVDLYNLFPNVAQKPNGWPRTDAEWGVFQQARARAIAVSELAKQWQEDQTRKKYIQKEVKKPEPWLFRLELTSHLQPPKDAKNSQPPDNGQVSVKQETASELKLTMLDPTTGDEWNGERKLEDLDRDTVSDEKIKPLLISELTMIKKVVDANRKLLETYYPNTLWPSSKVFSYVVLEEDQRVRWNWFVWSLAAFLIAGLFVDLNATSWHGYYAEQIARTWIEPAPGLGREIPLSQLETAPHGLPYHLISGTLNSFQYDPDNPRQTSLFLFSRLYCGADQTGYRPTEEFEAGKFMLADACAVSGGALSTFREKNPLRKCLLFLANFRLGQWVGNPAFQPTNWPFWETLARVWPVSPFRVMWIRLCKLLQSQRHVFVTDGGHTDNLGLEPLLRRRCRLIVAVDATEDPDFRFAELVRLTMWMSNMDGIKLTWNPPEFQAPNEPEHTESADAKKIDAGHPRDWLRVIPTSARDEKGRQVLRADAPQHWMLARIDYGDSGSGRRPTTGYLLYIKSNVCVGDPPELIEYQRTHSPFPHDPTSDLIFQADQFEAYRRLGETSARAVVAKTFRERPASNSTGKDPDHVMDWVHSLEKATHQHPHDPPPASSAPGPSAPPVDTGDLATELRVLEDSQQPWLRRKQAAERLATDSKYALAAVSVLAERLGTLDASTATECRHLLLELGSHVYPVLCGDLSSAKGKPLLRVIEVVKESLLLHPDESAARALIQVLDRKNLGERVRHAVEEAVKSLPQHNYTDSFWAAATQHVG